MSKPINEPRLVQQALIADEDLSFELAALVPPCVLASWRPLCERCFSAV